MLAIIAAIAFSSETPYLNAAKQAATWIRAELKKPGHTLELYSGTSGVALFFAESYYATGDKQYLADAKAIGDEMIPAIKSTKESGLYVGLAGMGFSLNEIAKATGERKYAVAALSCLEQIKKGVKPEGDWGEGNDIISGSAGVGCFLLYADKEMKQPSALSIARKVGDQLLKLGIAKSGGTMWKMSPDDTLLMPNFSHGTAGVAFFLARLYEETKDKKYLAAAESGAAYLLKHTNSDGLIFHDEKNGPSLCYLGWCHGPVGTSRLFGVLHRITGKPVYGDWIDHAAAALLKSGIPAKPAPGFWNNVSQCCGSAGVAEFFLDIYQFDRAPEEIAFAKWMTDDLLKRAGQEEGGLKWVQAEHRVQPDNLQAQIGYMQGAAGIGMWLLHLHYQEQGLRPKIYFPDNPFHGRH